MKKYLSLLLVLFALQMLSAQSDMYFYGMTSEGTEGGQGSIFKYKISDPTKPLLVHSFKVVAPGNSPDKVALKELPDGQIWGTTGYGGKYNRGVLFSYNPASNTYTVRHHFNGSDGSVVLSGIMLAKDKMIYGGSFRGGRGDSGVIYRLDPANDAFTKLFDLAEYQLAGITDRLMQHSNGRIYGTCFVGGGGGAIFSFDPDNPATLKVEHLFENSTGRQPVGGVTEYKGILYGVTRIGGDNRIGVLYSYDPADQSYTVLRHLDRSSGSVGIGAMTLYNDKLYGLLSNGGAANFGVLYSFDPNSKAYNMIQFFPGPDTSLGVLPLGELQLSSNNKLIGVCSQGGKYAGGTLFEFDPATSLVQQIGAFAPSEGYHPQGAPIRASNGKIYTITPQGGINSLGALVVQNHEVKDSIPSNLLSLNETPQGGSPCATLIQASDGKMYGTARFGGSLGLGVALQLDPLTDKVTVLDEFNWINGARPLNDFTEYNGRLYCTTSTGGPDDRLGDDPGIGTISSLDLSTFKLRKEARFPVVDFKAPDGGVPYCKLVLAPNNKMYGTTWRGGKNDLGVLFEFDPVSKKIKNKYDFNPTDGYRPIGSMALGEDGWLYGLAQKGGKFRKGSIYKFNYMTGDFLVVAPFGGRIDGRNAQSPLLYIDGVLYGLSYEGGQKRLGSIFSYDLAQDKFTRIASMDGMNGQYPYGGMSMGPDGKLYCFSSYGGTYNSGTALRIDPKTGEVEKLFDFNRDLGAVPYFTVPGLYNPTLATKQVKRDIPKLEVYPNPASSVIRFNIPEEQINSTDIFDASGILVKQVGNSGNKIDISNLLPGRYQIEIKLKQEDQRYKAVFVKQ